MNKKHVFGFLITFMFCFRMISPVLAADYTYPLEGAEGVASETTITTYDKKDWEKYVSEDYYPDDIWDGDADKEGAKSKQIVKEHEDKKLDVWDVAIILDPDYEDVFEENLGDDWEDVVEDAGDVYDSLDGKWSFWIITRDVWDFTEDEFDEDPDDEDVEDLILQDPKDAEDILEALNDITRYLTYLATYSAYITLGQSAAVAAAAAQAAGDAVEDTFSGDYIMWILVLELGMPMGKPVDDYVDDLMDALDTSKDIDYDADTNIITFEDEGEDDYIIEATISADYGAVSKVEYKADEDEDAFFVKESAAAGIPGYELPILLGITAVFTIGIIYAIRKRK
jgi:hypothetical protein